MAMVWTSLMLASHTDEFSEMASNIDHEVNTSRSRIIVGFGDFGSEAIIVGFLKVPRKINRRVLLAAPKNKSWGFDATRPYRCVGKHWDDNFLPLEYMSLELVILE